MILIYSTATYLLTIYWDRYYISYWVYSFFKFLLYICSSIVFQCLGNQGQIDSQSSWTHLKNLITSYLDKEIPEETTSSQVYFIPTYIIPPSRFKNPTIVFFTCLTIVARLMGQWQFLCSWNLLSCFMYLESFLINIAQQWISEVLSSLLKDFSSAYLYWLRVIY